MIPLGQFRDTFIIAIDDEGIAIIDQHVAHERVLFERVMERLTAGALESQRLLVPLLLELRRRRTRRSSAGRRARAPRLRARSLRRIDDQSHGRAGAADAPRTRSKALRALAEDLEGLDRGAQVQEALQRIAATTACHAAVKANYPLTLREDGAHPRGAAGDGVLDRLPARPAGDAAADAA